MFETRGNDIYISRGEAAALEIIPYENGEEYVLDPLEKLRLTVFDTVYTDSKLVKESALGETIINIDGKDTKGLRGVMGYSVKLIFADGSEKTIIGPAPTFVPRFFVMEA